MRAVEGLNVVITGPREFRSGSQASIGITASNPSTSTLSMDPVRIIEIRNERRSVEGTVSFLMPTKLSPGTSYSGSTEVTVPSPGSYTVGLPGRSETYLSFESK